MGLVNRLVFLVLSLAAFPAVHAAAPDTPLTAARFEISIDGHSVAVFSELAGISSAAAEPTSGSPARSMQVVLRRGLTRSIEMAAWHELVILGDVAAARKNVTFTMFLPDGTPVARYHLTDARPSRIEITTVKAGGSEALMETVTLTCEFIQRVSV